MINFGYLSHLILFYFIHKKKNIITTVVRAEIAMGLALKKPYGCDWSNFSLSSSIYVLFHQGNCLYHNSPHLIFPDIHYILSINITVFRINLKEFIILKLIIFSFFSSKCLLLFFYFFLIIYTLKNNLIQTKTSLEKLIEKICCKSNQYNLKCHS